MVTLLFHQGDWLLQYDIYFRQSFRRKKVQTAKKLSFALQQQQQNSFLLGSSHHHSFAKINYCGGGGLGKTIITSWSLITSHIRNENLYRLYVMKMTEWISHIYINGWSLQDMRGTIVHGWIPIPARRIEINDVCFWDLWWVFNLRVIITISSLSLLSDRTHWLVGFVLVFVVKSSKIKSHRIKPYIQPSKVEDWQNRTRYIDERQNMNKTHILYYHQSMTS